MKIKLTPSNTTKRISLSKQGNVLTINGKNFDFSVIPDGATLPEDAINSEWIVGDVSRVDGVIEITIRLPHGEEAPESTRFPEPIINPPDGEIVLPPYDHTEVQ